LARASSEGPALLAQVSEGPDFIQLGGVVGIALGAVFLALWNLERQSAARGAAEAAALRAEVAARDEELGRLRAELQAERKVCMGMRAGGRLWLRGRREGRPYQARLWRLRDRWRDDQRSVGGVGRVRGCRCCTEQLLRGRSTALTSLDPHMCLAGVGACTPATHANARAEA
jgi:hypothetical protein